MPENKGIEIVFRGETTAFDAAVKKINGELKQTKSDISLLNKELKFDPKNVEALTKKFDSLRQKEKQLTDLTQTLKQGLANMDPNDSKWDKYNKTLQKTELELQAIRKELNETSVASERVKMLGQGFQDFGGTLDKIGGKLEGIGKQLSVLSVGVVGLATSGVKFNAQLEQYETAFTTLIGDAEQAKEAIANIQQDAAVTPFSTDALIQANQYLLAAGVEANEARETIMALGDAIAATGGGSNELSRMAQNLQQIQNIGKASSVDIKQFANAGINIYGLLADYTGKSIEKIQEMDISYEVLSNALKSAASEGGKYFGAMDKQSQTLNGSISSIQDQINQLLGELTQELLPVIKEVLQFVRDLINRFKEMSPEQKAMVQNIAMIVAALGPAMTIIGKIVGAFGTLSSTIGSFLQSEKLLAVITKLTANGSSLGAVLKTVVGALKGATGIIGVVVALLAAVYASSEDFRAAVGRLVQSIVGLLNPAFNLIKTTAEVVMGIFRKLIDAVKDLWDKFMDSAAGQAVVEILTVITDIISGLIEGVKGLIEWAEKAVRWFGDLLGVTKDVETSTGNIGKSAIRLGQFGYMESGGYSNGMMSGGTYTFNNTFTLNGIGMDRQSANRFADMMTDRINENLGRRLA